MPSAECYPFLDATRVHFDDDLLLDDSGEAALRLSCTPRVQLPPRSPP